MRLWQPFLLFLNDEGNQGKTKRKQNSMCLSLGMGILVNYCYAKAGPLSGERRIFRSLEKNTLFCPLSLSHL